MNEARKLAQEIADCRAALNEKQAQYDRLIGRCEHDWHDPVYSPIEIAASYFPGDPEGTCGVDRRLPMNVPGRIEKRWSRTCRKCGHIEYTFRNKPAGIVPVF